jgi:hypothetical protein
MTNALRALWRARQDLVEQALPGSIDLGERRMARFLARHHYCGRNPGACCCAGCGAAPKVAPRRSTARPDTTSCLLRRRAGARRRAQSASAPAVPDPRSVVTPASLLAEIGDCGERSPTKASLAPDGGQAPRRRRLRQEQARAIPRPTHGTAATPRRQGLTEGDSHTRPPLRPRRRILRLPMATSSLAAADRDTRDRLRRSWSPREKSRRCGSAAPRAWRRVDTSLQKGRQSGAQPPMDRAPPGTQRLYHRLL